MNFISIGFGFYYYVYGIATRNFIHPICLQTVSVGARMKHRFHAFGHNLGFFFILFSILLLFKYI